MNKNEFLAQLRKSFSGASIEEIEERVAFYSEMIDDRMEEGLSETQAVSEILSMDETGTKMIAKPPIDERQNKKDTDKKSEAWKKILLAVGASIWFCLLLAVAVTVFALYVSLWAIIVSLWAAFVILIVTAFACILLTVVYFCLGHTLMSVAALGSASVLFGLAIFLFYGGKAATKGGYVLPKIILSKFKKYYKKCKKENRK